MMLSPRSTRQSGLTKARRRDGEVEAVLGAELEPARTWCSRSLDFAEAARHIAPSCNRSQISRSGDDAVTDSLQFSSTNSLWENPVLKRYSSESLDRTNGLDHALSDEPVRVDLRNSRGIARQNVTRATQPGLKKSGFTPDRADGDGNELPEHRAWLAVFTLFLEGCAMSAVLLHPEAAFPYKDFPVQENTVPKGGLLSPERPESASLVSATAIAKPTAIEHDPNLPTKVIGTSVDYVPAFNTRRSGYRDGLASLWEAVAVRWKLWRRQREVNKTVASLAELDDRTLRDIGITDRALIGHAARYYVDTWI
jgi:uncharacterized protein YjiS (DUF1127 family)